MKVINDDRSEFPILAIGIKQPEKNFRASMMGFESRPKLFPGFFIPIAKIGINCDDHLSLSNLEPLPKDC